MMKTHILDVLQVITAILITGSMAVAMRPAQLQAAPQNRVPRPKAVKVVSAVKPAPAASVKPQRTLTIHEQVMQEAGIAESDWPAVDYIVSHESGWDPNATEPTTGAHGLPQALPYSKTGCAWSDSVCQLKWADTYAVQRYGGWSNAEAYWAANRNW